MARVKRDNKAYLDYEGNKIGTEENLISAFGDVMFHIGSARGGYSYDLELAIEEYKGIRFCCDINTEHYDKELEESLSGQPTLRTVNV